MKSITFYIERRKYQGEWREEHGAICSEPLNWDSCGEEYMQDTAWWGLTREALQGICRLLGIPLPREGKQIKVTIQRAAECKVEEMK